MGAKINAVESSQKLWVKKDVRTVYMPMGTVYEALVKVGWLKSKQEKKQEIKKEEEHYYLYHERSLDHSIQGCQEFLDLV